MPVTLVRIAATLTLLGSLAFISTVAVAGDLSDREAFLLPASYVGSGFAALGLALLTLAGPSLLQVSTWVRVLVSTALTFTAAVAWFDATAIVGIASSTDDAAFDLVGGSTGLALLFAPKSLLGLVAFGALAVTGLRSGTMSRAAAAAFGLGALAFVLPPYPPGVVLVSIGFLLACRDARVSEPRRGSPAPTLLAG